MQTKLSNAWLSSNHRSKTFIANLAYLPQETPMSFGLVAVRCKVVPSLHHQQTSVLNLTTYSLDLITIASCLINPALLYLAHRPSRFLLLFAA
jgi:hypothetical protein